MAYTYRLPVNYNTLKPWQRRQVREQYVREQGGKCAYCGESLTGPPPTSVTSNPINWRLFPPGFCDYPVHLHHDHDSGLTEGAVHYYCNAVMWQYHGR